MFNKRCTNKTKWSAKLARKWLERLTYNRVHSMDRNDLRWKLLHCNISRSSSNYRGEEQNSYRFEAYRTEGSNWVYEIFEPVDSIQERKCLERAQKELSAYLGISQQNTGV